MSVFVAVLVIPFALAYHCEANYCVCNSGLSDSVLQENIDYACGAGADCSAIQQNGACFNPNTVEDHCNYAVNSYYQMEGQAPGSCNFQGTAAITQTPPNAPSGCVYPSGPSNVGTTIPPNNPTTTIGGNPNTAGATNQSTMPTTGGSPPIPTGASNPGTFPGSSGTDPGVGLGPSTGIGFSNPDSSSGCIVLVKSHISKLKILLLSVLLFVPLLLQ